MSLKQGLLRTVDWFKQSMAAPARKSSS